MDDIAKLLILVIIALIKLVITGICLAIGFKIGYLAIEKADKYVQDKKKTVHPEAVAV